MNAIEPCPKCDRITFHVGNYLCVCGNCDYSIKTEDYWKSNLVDQRKQKSTMTFSGVYACKICGEAFASEEELREHHDSHEKVSLAS
jgi:ribosomal protein L37E